MQDLRRICRRQDECSYATPVTGADAIEVYKAKRLPDR
jgi:hypothetical protein